LARTNSSGNGDEMMQAAVKVQTKNQNQIKQLSVQLMSSKVAKPAKHLTERRKVEANKDLVNLMTDDGDENSSFHIQPSPNQVSSQ